MCARGKNFVICTMHCEIFSVNVRLGSMADHEFHYLLTCWVKGYICCLYLNDNRYKSFTVAKQKPQMKNWISTVKQKRNLPCTNSSQRAAKVFGWGKVQAGLAYFTPINFMFEICKWNMTRHILTKNRGKRKNFTWPFNRIHFFRNAFHCSRAPWQTYLYALLSLKVLWKRLLRK